MSSACLGRPFSPFILITDLKPCLLWLALTILLFCLSLLDAACLIAGLFLCITIYLLSLKVRIYGSHLLLLHIYQPISSLHHSPRPTRLVFCEGDGRDIARSRTAWGRSTLLSNCIPLFSLSLSLFGNHADGLLASVV